MIVDFQLDIRDEVSRAVHYHCDIIRLKMGKTIYLTHLRRYLVVDEWTLVHFRSYFLHSIAIHDKNANLFSQQDFNRVPK